MPSALCSLPYALCPMPYALCPLPSALCPLLSALCPLLSALCPLLSALCSLPSALCSLLSALCPLPSALCSLPSALCPLLSALCSLPSALCPLLSALCSLPSALCPLPSALCPLPSAYYIRRMKFSNSWYMSLPILWGAWIIYLSLLPGNAGILTLFHIPHFDKVAHMGAYGIWSFLFLFASGRISGYSGIRSAWMVASLCLVGCGLEFAQYYLHEGRSFEVLDMVANTIGALLGWAGGKVLKWI